MKSVTGAMLYYYYVCDRKLWYFSHQLDMEHTSDLVQIGKLIDEESYNREKKHIMIDDVISIDFLQNWRIVHEVKKSKSVEIASIWQLKYYMWILENKGEHNGRFQLHHFHSPALQFFQVFEQGLTVSRDNLNHEAQ